MDYTKNIQNDIKNVKVFLVVYVLLVANLVGHLKEKSVLETGVIVILTKQNVLFIFVALKPKRKKIKKNTVKTKVANQNNSIHSRIFT